MRELYGICINKTPDQSINIGQIYKLFDDGDYYRTDRHLPGFYPSRFMIFPDTNLLKLVTIGL